MTPSAFAKQLVAAYRAARVPLFPSEKLFRGESRGVASAVEDLLAFYLIANLPRIDTIRINQPMAIAKSGTIKTIKPDLVIVRNRAIRALVDLKMDLGYKRSSIVDSFRKAMRSLDEMRNNKATYWESKRAAGGVQRTLRTSARAVYMFVVVTDRNISQSDYAAAEAGARRHGVILHTLIRGIHPNDHGVTESDARSRCQVQLAISLPNLERDIMRALT
jgi:hypothetical protein